MAVAKIEILFEYSKYAKICLLIFTKINSLKTCVRDVIITN